jgi:hypothetical protein
LVSCFFYREEASSISESDGKILLSTKYYTASLSLKGVALQPGQGSEAENLAENAEGFILIPSVVEVIITFLFFSSRGFLTLTIRMIFKQPDLASTIYRLAHKAAEIDTGLRLLVCFQVY